MYKYLGHCINDELSDDDDMTRQRNKVYAQGNALKWSRNEALRIYVCATTI